MEFELTIATVTVFGFILGGIRSIVYRQIIKERNSILPKIDKDYKKLLKKSKILSDEEKKNFIRDFVGLYKLEVGLKNAERDLRNLFIGFASLCSSAFIYEIAIKLADPSLSSLLFLMIFILLPLSGFYSLIGTFSLTDTYNWINIYKSGKLPRELVGRRELNL
jgi:hypothetical protein